MTTRRRPETCGTKSRRPKSEFHANACPNCGGTTMSGYKRRDNMAKCLSCGYWYDTTRYTTTGKRREAAC